MDRRTWLGALLSSFSVACATCPTPAPQAAPTAGTCSTPPGPGAPKLELPSVVMGSDTSAIGHLDAGVLQRVLQIQLVDHVKLVLNHDGSVRKFEVYHDDAAPIPQPVRALLKQLFPVNKIITYETEWHQDDGEITELIIRDSSNRICEMSATNSGTMRYVECRIAPQDLPAAVRASIDSLLKESRIEEANQFEDKEGRAFKVDVRQGTLLHGLKLSPNGKLLAHTIKINAQLVIAE